MVEKECKCFAFQERKNEQGKKYYNCLVLNKLVCRYSYSDCPFYKTNEQLEKEQSRTIHRLKNMNLYKEYKEIYGI